MPFGQGSFSLDPGAPPLGGSTTPLYVFKYIQGNLASIPNVQMLGCAFTEGDDPPTARFAYVMDDRAAAQGWPTRYEQLWPLRTTDANDVGPYIVLPGDRLVAYAGMPDGSYRVLFDGFARMPQVDVGGDGQHVVSFSAVGVAFRAYDLPIQGRVQRNGAMSQVQDVEGQQDQPTNLPTRFNPVDAEHPTGQPNCTPKDFDTDPDGQGQGVAYPVFLDPRIVRPDDPDHSPRLWTLSGAVRYLLAQYNPRGSPPPEEADDPPEATFEAFVANPDFTDLENLLDSRRPKDGLDFFNPNDPGTYDADPIVVRDFDCTNMAWPEALSRMLGYHGFGMRWVLSQDQEGLPQNSFEVYRKDAGASDVPKSLAHAPQGSPINPAANNVGTLSAAFDYHSVANSFVIETHPNRYEVSVVLAPLFRVEKADAKYETRKGFIRSALDTADEATRRKYRWYGVDDLGDGYWDWTQEQWIEDTAFDFSPLWPNTQDPDTGETVRNYVYRYRPGIMDCLTTGGTGDTLKAELALSRNYAGLFPSFWDGTGDWQPIEGDWKLLDDRLGIEFTADDPEEIHVGKTDLGPNAQNHGTVLKGVTSVASPGGSGFTDTRFFLRLTVVIESDQTLEATAKRRLASPLANEVRRRIDAKDHFRKDTIHTSSANFVEQPRLGNATVYDDDGNLLARDDTKAAEDHAAQLRTAHEFPPCPIAVNIPGLSLAYKVGDRVSDIRGRAVSLQCNSGVEQDEAISYPFVVAVTHDFTGDNQVTTLQLSDRRLEPQPLEHRRGR